MMQYIVDRARRTVCANASDPCEARDLMLMLGIYPGQEFDEQAVDPGLLPTRRLQ